jgi:prepilin-type N-terminal cleavage/methylation domain-containing protein
MRRTPRTSNRKGFTLIELLIVVVIIGILAAVAIPKFSNTKEKAYIAGMKSDLKNLVSIQESYFADKSAYGTKADVTVAPYGFQASNKSVIGTIPGTATGWSASLTNPAVSSVTACSVWSGTAADSTASAAIGGASQEGVPSCK